MQFIPGGQDDNTKNLLGIVNSLNDVRRTDLMQRDQEYNQARMMGDDQRMIELRRQSAGQDGILGNLNKVIAGTPVGNFLGVNKYIEDNMAPNYQKGVVASINPNQVQPSVPQEVRKIDVNAVNAQNGVGVAPAGWDKLDKVQAIRPPAPMTPDDIYLSAWKGYYKKQGSSEAGLNKALSDPATRSAAIAEAKNRGWKTNAPTASVEAPQAPQMSNQELLNAYKASGGTETNPNKAIQIASKNFADGTWDKQMFEQPAPVPSSTINPATGTPAVPAGKNYGTGKAAWAAQELDNLNSGIANARTPEERSAAIINYYAKMKQVEEHFGNTMEPMPYQFLNATERRGGGAGEQPVKMAYKTGPKTAEYMLVPKWALTSAAAKKQYITTKFPQYKDNYDENNLSFAKEMDQTQRELYNLKVDDETADQNAVKLKTIKDRILGTENQEGMNGDMLESNLLQLNQELAGLGYSISYHGNFPRFGKLDPERVRIVKANERHIDYRPDGNGNLKLAWVGGIEDTTNVAKNTPPPNSVATPSGSAVKKKEIQVK